jgi:hypothetical protein
MEKNDMTTKRMLIEQQCDFLERTVYEAFDYQTRKYKFQSGNQRVRILPTIDPDSNPLDFIRDYYLIIGQVFTYVRDLDAPVCKAVEHLRSSENPKAEAIYKVLRPKLCYQFQVIELESDGLSIVNPIPQLMQLPGIAALNVLKLSIEGAFDLPERDLVICRTGEGVATRYTGIHFEPAKIEVPQSVLKERLHLDANRSYDSRRWEEPLAEIYRQLGLDPTFDDDYIDW